MTVRLSPSPGRPLPVQESRHSFNFFNFPLSEILCAAPTEQARKRREGHKIEDADGRPNQPLEGESRGASADNHH